MAEITGYSDMQIVYDAITIDISTKDYEIDKYEQESVKFEFDNQYDSQYLYKKGNRWIREIVITQTHHTNVEFRALAIQFMQICGRAVTLTPHIDEPTKTELAWCEAFWDRYNDYPIEKIKIKLEAVEID